MKLRLVSVLGAVMFPLLGAGVISGSPRTWAAPTRGSADAGSLLYQTNWKHGTLGWQTIGDSDYNTVHEELTYDGGGRSTLLAPFKTRRLTNFAIEMQVQALADDSGLGLGAIGILVKGDKSREGMAAGLFYSTSVGLWNTANADDQWIRSDFTPGEQWHTYRIEVRGNHYRLFVDGALAGRVTTNQFLSTRTYPRVGIFDFDEEVDVSAFRVYALR